MIEPLNDPTTAEEIAALRGRVVTLERGFEDLLRDLKRVASPAAGNTPEGTAADRDPEVFALGVATGMWGYGTDVTPPPPDTPPGGPPPAKTMND